MSSSDRRQFLATLAALPLAGCGFTPVYGPAGGARSLRGGVLIDAPTTRDEFELVEQLEKRLMRAEAPRYGLAVVLKTTSEGLAVTGGNDITRYNVLGEASFALRDLNGDKVLITDRVTSFTAYSATTSTVGTLAAERDAYTRLMTILADKIVTRLIAASGSLP